MDTCEVRWFAPGPIPGEVLTWFAEQSTITTIEERSDTYVLHGIDGLGIKYRDQEVLEVKLRNSIASDLVLGPGLRAPLLRWQKWRPQELDELWSAPDLHRVNVHKEVLKSSFTLIDGAVAASPDLRRDGTSPACTIELATVVVEGVTSWTLGLEATGPVEARRRMLADSWHAVADGSLPEVGFAGHFDVAAAYPEWLEHHLPYRLPE